MGRQAGFECGPGDIGKVVNACVICRTETEAAFGGPRFRAMPDQRELAREWISHHLEAASAQAEKMGDTEVQELIDRFIRSLGYMYKMPEPP